MFLHTSSTSNELSEYGSDVVLVRHWGSCKVRCTSLSSWHASTGLQFEQPAKASKMSQANEPSINAKDGVRKKEMKVLIMGLGRTGTTGMILD